MSGGYQIIPTDGSGDTIPIVLTYATSQSFFNQHAPLDPSSNAVPLLMTYIPTKRYVNLLSSRIDGLASVLDVSGNIGTGTGYFIGGTEVLSGSALGAGVTASSLTSVGTLSGGLNIATGQAFKVAGTDVLSSTTLGAGVTASSLTSVGTLGRVDVSGNVSCSGLLSVSRISEGISNLGTLGAGVSTITLDFSSSKSLYYVTPSSNTNLTCAITNVPTSTQYSTYNFTVVVNDASYNPYINSVTVNGTAATLSYNGGVSSVSVTAPARVVQSIVVMFLASATPSYCLTSVSTFT